MRDDRLATGRRRVEVGVEDAGGGGELEHTGGAYADVEFRAAELRLERGGGSADHRFETGYRIGLGLHRLANGRGGAHRFLAGAGAEQDSGGELARGRVELHFLPRWNMCVASAAPSSGARRLAQGIRKSHAAPR